jgi:DHA2 family multidrug resistance protein
MMNLMRNLGGGIGISVASTMLLRRAQLHQERISATATRYFPPFAHYMNSIGGFTTKNLFGFYQSVQLQASMLAFLDVFKTFGIGCIIVICLVLMLKPVKKRGKPVAMH